MQRLVILLLCAIAIKGSTSEDTKPDIPKNDNTRSINGHPATTGEIPWQAALFFQETPDSKFWFCSGSVIGKNWILTTAHCVHNAQSVLVYAGIIDISQDIKPTDIAKEFISHKNFSPDSFDHDIALIKLTHAVTLNENITAIPLSSDEAAVGTTITVSGWGITRKNDSSISALLNYVDLTTISKDKCEEVYGDSSFILSNIICAAANTDPLQAPCKGESGAPAVVDFGTKARQIAIASFVNDESCVKGLPSGYTNVVPYLDWIQEKTGI